MTNVSQIVPTYQTEISPSPLRGFFVGSIQLFLTFGSLIAGIVNNSMSYYTTDAGWIIATALQVLPAVIILAGIAFTPGKAVIKNTKRSHANLVPRFSSLAHQQRTHRRCAQIIEEASAEGRRRQWSD